MRYLRFDFKAEFIILRGGNISGNRSFPEDLKIPEDIPKDEFEKYWNCFQDSKYFAAIKIGGGCYEEKSDEFLGAISFLDSYGLHPMIIHGGGKQIDRALEREGISTEKENGVRITSEEAMDVIENTLKGVNEDIVEKADFDCRGLHGIFKGKLTEGYTAKAKGIFDEAKEYLGEETAIISPVGRWEGNYYNINADSAWRELVMELQPEKSIILTESGGVRKEGSLQYRIEAEELQEVIEEYASGGMEVKLKEASKLVEKGFDVQIASPENLIYELFTDKGRGTYIHSR